jgi:gliding motility-associated-like protein
MKKKDNIEDIFKDSFENFEAEVSPSIWANIQTALKGAGIGLLGKTLLNKIGTNTIVAIISSAAAVISTVVVMNWGSNHKKIDKTQKNIVVENPKPVNVDEIKQFLSAEKKDINSDQQSNDKSETPPSKDQYSTAIKKEKINTLINEYSASPIAVIAANPVGGTVPLVINLSNSGTGKINKWSFGDGQKETSSNPVHVYDVPGLYTIALSSTNSDGTIAYDSVKVEVTGNSSLASIPTSFSPNGDGDKDFFVFKSANIINLSAIVVDPKGKTVFVGDVTKNRWDGKDLKGKKVKEGAYFYFLTAEGVDGKKFEQKGKIILSR